MTNFEYLRMLAYHAACLFNQNDAESDSFEFETNRIRIEFDEGYFVLTDKTTGEKIFRYGVGFDDENYHAEFVDQINPTADLFGSDLVEPEDFADGWEGLHLHVNYYN